MCVAVCVAVYVAVCVAVCVAMCVAVCVAVRCKRGGNDKWCQLVDDSGQVVAVSCSVHDSGQEVTVNCLCTIIIHLLCNIKSLPMLQFVAVCCNLLQYDFSLLSVIYHLLLIFISYLLQAVEGRYAAAGCCVLQSDVSLLSTIYV